MSFSKTDSKVITRLRFPLACLIVLLHAQIIEPEFRPVVAASGFAYALKILLSEGVCRIAVPSFFLISGYLFFIKLEQWNSAVWLDKMKRRVHTLLIPYILWNLVGIAYVCITPYVGVMTENPESLIHAIYPPPVPVVQRCGKRQFRTLLSARRQPRNPSGR